MRAALAPATAQRVATAGNLAATSGRRASQRRASDAPASPVTRATPAPHATMRATSAATSCGRRRRVQGRAPPPGGAPGEGIHQRQRRERQQTAPRHRLATLGAHSESPSPALWRAGRAFVSGTMSLTPTYHSHANFHLLSPELRVPSLDATRDTDRRRPHIDTTHPTGAAVQQTPQVRDRRRDRWQLRALPSAPRRSEILPDVPNIATSARRFCLT